MRQFEVDLKEEAEKGPKVLTTLYPALGSRELVCTKEAAETFLTIVMQLGSEAEKKRAKLMFSHVGDDSTENDSGESQQDRVAAFQ
jgi:hypothetical protein